MLCSAQSILRRAWGRELVMQATIKYGYRRYLVREFVEDVRTGMSDEALQKKYVISRKKFFLYKGIALDITAKEKSHKPRPKIQINAVEFLDDIRSGVDDEELMVKYRLIPRHLQSAFRKMIAQGFITPLELCNRLKVTKSQVREAFLEMGRAVEELN
jgi:hypothetical protein